MSRSSLRSKPVDDQFDQMGAALPSGARQGGGKTMGDLKFVPVFQGETRISGSDNEVMTTILGSCVAACIWDPVAGVGGLNHFLLPGQASDRGSNLRYGVNAMELLINGLLKKGAERAQLRVKLLGGAKMIDSGAEIGVKNAEFAHWYMKNEELAIVSSCLGGERGRKIRFWPTSGRLQRSFLTNTIDIDVRRTAEPAPAAPTSGDNDAGDVQLF